MEKDTKTNLYHELPAPEELFYMEEIPLDSVKEQIHPVVTVKPEKETKSNNAKIIGIILILLILAVVIFCINMDNFQIYWPFFEKIKNSFLIQKIYMFFVSLG